MSRVVGPAIVDPQVAPDGPAEFLQSLQERPDARLRLRIIRGQIHEHADAPHPLALLRARGERRRHGHAAERDYELSSSDVDGHVTLPKGSCPFQGERYHALAKGE